jgi:hypothetical protein
MCVTRNKTNSKFKKNTRLKILLKKLMTTTAERNLGDEQRLVETSKCFDALKSVPI